MGGQLKLKGISIKYYELSMSDMVNHFGSIQDVEFTPGKNGNNYFDLVVQAFAESTINITLANKLLMPHFHTGIQKLFSDKSIKTQSKLKELGATDIDSALITGDVARIKKLASANLETNIYQLAKDYRFIKISESINSFIKFNDINIPIADCNTSLAMLDYLAFVYDKNIHEPRNVLINLEDDGGIIWNYNGSALWNSYLKNFFDVSILYGNGSAFLMDSLVDKFFRAPDVVKLTEKDLDFALVLINMHDSPTVGRFMSVFNKFPQLGKETLYVVQGCYSGQYHKVLPRGCHLITGSSAEEMCFIGDLGNLVNLSKYMDKSGPDLKGFLKFFANEYGKREYALSTPHFSGTIEGTSVKYEPVKEIVKRFAIEQIDEENEELGLESVSTGSIINENVHIFSVLDVSDVTTTRHEISANIVGDDSSYDIPDYDSIPHYGLCSLM